MGANFWQALLGISLLFLQDAGVMSSRGASVTSKDESTEDLLHLSATKEIVSGGGINSIQIEPPQLVFKNSPTCIPGISMIDILNIHETEELQILSITSDNAQFHPAIFKPQVLPPEGRATIQIIYLPRNIGSNIEGKLTIVTSFGEINYNIQASAVANPYRLHPFIGTKIPAGVVYSRPIIMYNPTDEPLHVREVFTTESYLTLHLPDDLISSSQPFEFDDLEEGDSAALTDDYFQPQATLSSPTSSEGLWVIPPKSEKEIIHLIFHASSPGPFNGYVHVKSDLENMVLPVELHVLKGGLHPTPKSFDFGVLTSPDEKRVVSISLLNSGNLPIELLDAIPSLHDPSLEVSFNKGLVIPPGIVAESVVHLIYSGERPGPTRGKVIMTTNHSNSGLASVEVHYSADVLHGGVGYERNHVSFLVPVVHMKASMQPNQIDSSKESFLKRSVPFTNYFPIPLHLKSVSTESCGGVLNVGNLSTDETVLIAPPQRSWPDLELSFDIKAAMQSLNLPHTCSLTLVTNVSTHNIPVHIYDGGLKVSLEEVAKNGSCISKPIHSNLSHVAIGDELTISNDRAVWMDEEGDCFGALPSDMEKMEVKSKMKIGTEHGHDIKHSGFHRGGVKMEFGKLAFDQTRSRLINVTNLNPVPVNVSAFMTDMFLNQTASSNAKGSSSNKVVQPFSEFFFRGQYLSPHANSELVEVYEDMLSQGLVPPSSTSFHDKTDAAVRESRQRVNYGKFGILPGHTAMFEVEVYSGSASLSKGLNASSTVKKSSKSISKKQTKRSYDGLILIMETPVEVIRYHMSLDIIRGSITASSDVIHLVGNSKHAINVDSSFHKSASLQLSSSFSEDILVCDLVSQSDWIDLSLVASTAHGHLSLNSLHRSQECSDISGFAYVLPGLSTKAKSKNGVDAFSDVGLARLSPLSTLCADMWDCIGKWANQIAYPYTDSSQSMSNRSSLLDPDDDLEFLEEEEKRSQLEKDKAMELFAAFDIHNDDDIRASRMISKDLVSMIAAITPFGGKSRLEVVSDDELLTLPETLMVSSAEHDHLAKLNDQWETFKSFGLHHVKSKVSAVTSVGLMKDITTLSTELNVPKLRIEKSGFGVAHVGDVESEYLTVHNDGDEPITVQLTALVNDPLVAFAKNNNAVSSVSASTHQRELQGGVDSEWWNMKLKTVNLGTVSGTVKQQDINDPSSHWRNHNRNSEVQKDRSHVLGRSQVMNLVSATSGEIGSTCPLVDGSCYLRDVNGSTDVNLHSFDHQSGGSFHFPTWKIDPKSLPINQTLYELARRANQSKQPVQPFYVPFNASRPITIQPGRKSFIGPLFFRPPTLGQFHAIVYLRNSVSRLEMIDLDGKAGSGKAVVRTKGGFLHKVGEVFTLKFILNTSFWQPYNLNETIHAESTKERASSWISSLDSTSQTVKGGVSSQQERYSSEHDHIQSILKGSSSAYYDPPVWPSPAIHIVRVENHGNMAIDITNIVVGSLMEPKEVSRSIFPSFGNNYLNENRHINPCVGFNSGFVVQGCEELPVTLGPLQAWNVLVSYYADCSTINDVDTLRIESSVGSFDIILQAIAKKSDMAKCESYKMEAIASYSSMFVRLPIVVVTFIMVVFSLLAVKSMYESIGETDSSLKVQPLPHISTDSEGKVVVDGMDLKNAVAGEEPAQRGTKKTKPKKGGSPTPNPANTLKKNRKVNHGSSTDNNTHQVQTTLEPSMGSESTERSKHTTPSKSECKSPKQNVTSSKPEEDQVHLEFLVQVENEDQSVSNSSMLTRKQIPDSSLQFNKDPTPTKQTPSKKKASPTSSTNISNQQSTVRVNATVLSTPPGSNASSQSDNCKSDSVKSDTAKSRREKKKMEESQKKDKSDEKSKKELADKSSKRDLLVKRDSDKEKTLSRHNSDKEKSATIAKESRDRLKHQSDMQREVNGRLLASKLKDVASSRKKEEELHSKKKKDQSAKTTTTNPSRIYEDMDDGISGIGISGGWTQPPAPQPSPLRNLSRPDPHSQDLGVGNMFRTLESSPSFGPSSLSMSTVGSSPLRRAPLETNMPALHLSTEPNLDMVGRGTDGNNFSDSTLNSSGGGIDTSLFSNSSSGFSSLGHSGFGAAGRSLFSPQKSASQESDLNVDSFFADLSSSIAASLDLDISEPLNESDPLTSRLNIPSMETRDPLFQSHLVGNHLGSDILDPPTLSQGGTNTLSPTIRSSRLSHYINTEALLNSPSSGGVSSVDGNVPDYHKHVEEMDFFEQSQSFFGSSNTALLDDEVLEDEENYLQGGDDEGDWE